MVLTFTYAIEEGSTTIRLGRYCLISLTLKWALNSCNFDTVVRSYVRYRKAQRESILDTLEQKASW